MQAYRPDRLVGALNTLVSVAYFGLWVVAAIILIAMPAVKEFAGDDPDWTLGMGKRVAVHSEATMLTSRGPARVDVRVHGDLELPIAMLPWSIVAMRWAHAAVGFALMLMFLHHLRFCQSTVSTYIIVNTGRKARRRRGGFWCGRLPESLRSGRRNGLRFGRNEPARTGVGLDRKSVV